MVHQRLVACVFYKCCQSSLACPSLERGLCLMKGAISGHSQHFYFQECESDPCCEPGTCRLRSGAECAYGDCCKNCQVRDSNVILGSVLQCLRKGEH